MAVSESDVLHVAALARLAIDADRLPSLVAELNGILGHMDVLQSVDSGPGSWDVGGTGSIAPMRSDASGAPVPLEAVREAFAPEMRDGFFLVPRLATHEDQGDSAS